MRKVVLFIAMSMDGYIADIDGNVDWLGGENKDEDSMSSYQEFVKEVDTVIMGYRTYHQIVTELTPNQWGYEQMISYVITHRPIPSTDMIKFTNEDPCQLIERLKQEEGKNIWICGGAHLVNQLIKEDLVDRYHLNIMPILLGNGIPLFEKMNQAIPLTLIKSESYNGITDLIYERRLK